jgi:hypothetical protein
MTLTRTLANEIQIDATMTGGSLDGDGEASVSFLDTTPNNGSFTFDTFAFRPDGNDVSATTIDFTSFTVQVPEPTTFALLGLGGLAFLIRRRS